MVMAKDCRPTLSTETQVKVRPGPRRCRDASPASPHGLSGTLRKASPSPPARCYSPVRFAGADTCPSTFLGGSAKIPAKENSRSTNVGMVWSPGSTQTSASYSHRAPSTFRSCKRIAASTVELNNTASQHSLPTCLDSHQPWQQIASHPLINSGSTDKSIGGTMSIPFPRCPTPALAIKVAGTRSNSQLECTAPSTLLSWKTPVIAAQPVAHSTDSKTPVLHFRNGSKTTLKQETTMDSPDPTHRSHEKTYPTLVAQAEEDASIDKTAALVAEKTAEALLLPALQESLARVQELEEGLTEEQDRNKTLNEKFAAESMRVLQLEAELKLMATHNKQLTDKCAAESARAQQLDKELNQEKLRYAQLKTSCARNVDSEEKLGLVLEEWAPLESQVTELTSNNDRLTLVSRRVVGLSDLSHKELVRLARDVTLLPTVVSDKNAAIDEEDTDSWPQ